MVSQAYIIPYIILALFSILVIRVSSFSEQKITSKFANDILGSKRGDKVKRLDRVKQYLVKYGYLNPSGGHPSEKGVDGFEVLDHSVEEGIKKFQTFFHLDVSGELDEKTLSLMTMPRCGCPDLVNGSIITHGLSQSKGSYYVTGPKWSKLDLTWAVKPHTRKNAYKPIYYALRRWALNTKFNFIKSNDFNKSDLKIGFFRLNHGDSGPFDGRGGTLAHAGMPPDGGVHFDGDENWVVGAKPDGLDIETVALHELGHALGLGHSTVEAAIMWPYIPTSAVKRLNVDDIAGIKALYNFPWLTNFQ